MARRSKKVVKSANEKRLADVVEYGAELFVEDEELEELLEAETGVLDSTAVEPASISSALDKEIAILEKWAMVSASWRQQEEAAKAKNITHFYKGEQAIYDYHSTAVLQQQRSQAGMMSALMDALASQLPLLGSMEPEGIENIKQLIFNTALKKGERRTTAEPEILPPAPKRRVLG